MRIRARKASHGRRPMRRSRTSGIITKRLRSLEEVTFKEHPKKYILFSQQTGSANGVIGLNVYTTPQQVQLNNVVRGLTVQNRIADWAFTTGFHMQGQITVGTLAQGQNTLHMWLVYDKETNFSAQTFVTKWFGTTTPSVYALKNFNNQDLTPQWRILNHKVMKLKETISNSTENYNFRFGWKCRRGGKALKTGYQGGNAGTIADISSGAIYFVIYCDNPNAGSSYVQLNAEAVFYFRDGA